MPVDPLTAILLAAGYGTRARALFPDTPKALIPVGGRALLDHLLANLARSGAINAAAVVTNDLFLPAPWDSAAIAEPLIGPRPACDGRPGNAIRRTGGSLFPDGWLSQNRISGSFAPDFAAGLYLIRSKHH